VAALGAVERLRSNIGLQAMANSVRCAPASRRAWGPAFGCRPGQWRL